MALKFGNTWWGSEWLKSLNHIDYENRIPRGASYARKGMVQELHITKNIITAKVTGSTPRPYNVRIEVPLFGREEIDLFISELYNYPNIISQLLNGELSPKVLDIATGCGLKIFPERWDDLLMSCSCPDWAVPCKHLAAVVYMISREIDNNPFMAFSIHGLDLLRELEKRGVSVENLKEDMKVPMVKDIVLSYDGKSKIGSDLEEDGGPERIDFSVIEDVSEALFLLLTDQPPFSQSENFKTTYVKELNRIKRQARLFLKNKLNPDDVQLSLSVAQRLSREDEVRLVFDDDMKWTVANHRFDTGSLSAALTNIHPDLLPDYHPTVIALYQAHLCALHLLANGMVAPQIIALKSKGYAIRWNPAYVDRNVQRIMERLEEIIPLGTVKHRRSAPDGEEDLAKQGEWVVALFTGMLIQDFSSGTNTSAIHDLFFKGERNRFTEIGERETPGGIKAWTDAYTIIDTDYRPAFFIKENKTSGFDLDIYVEDVRHPDREFVPLRDIMREEEYKDLRIKILRSFTLIAKIMNEVNDYIDRRAESPIHYTIQAFVPMLTMIIPAIKMLNIKVFMPKSLQNLIRPQATIRVKTKSPNEGGYISLLSLFDFDWQIALGNNLVDIEEFVRLSRKAEGLIKFKQDYIYTTTEDLNKLKAAFEDTKRFSTVELLHIALTEEYDAAPVVLTDEAKEIIRQIRSHEEIAVPEGLNAILRPYQVRGFSWMYHNMRIGFGSILADDMGLGKTIQVITLILKLKEEGGLKKKKVLIIAPTGLLTNWQSEIERFAPGLSAFVYHGSNRRPDDFDADIMLTSYGVLRSDHTELKRLKWRTVFIDEAQNIKNHDTAQSKAVKSIPADTHIALSGTPVENRLTEFWSIMDFTNKGYLGSVKAFKTNFANPIQFYNNKTCIERFKKITAPFMMRRMKTDKSIISDLPDKIELNDYTSLKPDQATLYKKTLEEAMAEIEGIESMDHRSLFKRQGLILQMILALKQICNHPAQFLKNADHRSELSGKAEVLLERIETILENDEKVLIFTQFREMGNMLMEFIETKTGKTPMFYHGGCTVEERQQMVERFQHNRSDKIFILSLKAAGTGLNLTAATHVIHYDLWWNPAVESQATDRAFRIGQKKNVIVHRLITKNTFEEKIDQMIQEKKQLAELTVSSGENWISKLSNEELREIFG